jgi:hypothetical protein
MISRFGIVGMVFNVSLGFPAILKKHLAADLMESTPFFIVGGRAKFVFEFRHCFKDVL